MAQNDIGFTANTNRASAPAIWPEALRMRLQGPGGYYNLGNALGLAAGIGFQFVAARSDADATLAGVVREYLVGSPGATALTIAMVMFFISGEMYHRAFAAASGPHAGMMRRADLLSGIAALVLAIALALFGNLWLVLVSTVLLAGGKLGNAVSPAGCWPLRLEWLSRCGTTLYREVDLFRLTPILSRLPAIMAILLEMARLLAAGSPGTALYLGQSAILLICYLLWARADLLLLPRRRVG
jgi:hypothetical protein